MQITFSKVISTSRYICSKNSGFSCLNKKINKQTNKQTNTHNTVDMQ